MLYGNEAGCDGGGCGGVGGSSSGGGGEKEYNNNNHFYHEFPYLLPPTFVIIPWHLGLSKSGIKKYQVHQLKNQV